MTQAIQKPHATQSFVIVITVTHSVEYLRECLTSLEKLDYPEGRYQVALVDCGMLSGLRRFLEEELQNYALRITGLRLPDRNKKVRFHDDRINEARNYAVSYVSGSCYVFTEDDCTFEPDWLSKFEAALTEDVGALGGPDFLPEGMGWLPGALDCVLNSYFGTAGARRVDNNESENYYPRKVNMAIRAEALRLVGGFPEEMVFGAELDMAKRIRDAGLRVKSLPDNPVWHKRVATLPNIIRINAATATEKVVVLRSQSAFIKSPHFVLLMATVLGAIVGLLALVSNYARVLFGLFVGMYAAILFFVVLSSLVKTRSFRVALGTLLLLPLFHFSIAYGVVRGVMAKVAIGK